MTGAQEAGPARNRPLANQTTTTHATRRVGHGVEQTVAAWAGRIRPHLQRTVEGIVGAGRELIEAKAALPHGQFGPLLAELGLSRDMAQRFMRVARHPVLGNAEHAQHLPAAIESLVLLTRVPDDELAEAIEAGQVTPATTRAEATALAATDDPVARYRALDRQAEHYEALAELEGRIQVGLERILDLDPDTFTEVRDCAVAAGVDPDLVELIAERIEARR